MPASIFAGTKVKTLKDILSLNGGADVISSTTDPTSVAVDALKGSLLLNTSNGELYKKLDDGSSTNWEIVGTGGAGGINYVDNPDAEANTVGWATYADAAASRPVDGTGGSPTVTWTRVTSSPLRGIASFLFTKDAANRQGEGVSYDLTIDSADQARVLQISFDYEIASGTYSGGSSSADSDLIVYVYRTTATGRLIEPSVIKLDGGVSGVKYSYRGEFQADSDATGYRLILHCATTSASAYTVKMDNFIVGPSKNVAGAITTEWVSFTPTGGWNTNVTYSGKWRRVGDSMELRALVTCSGAPNAASLSFNMPSGYSIDTNKIETAAQAENLGYGTAFDTGTQQYMLYCTYGASATELRPRYINEGAGATGNTVSNVIPFTFGNTDTVEIFAMVPIVGWGATATLGQDADTRVTTARASTAAGQSIPNATDTIVNFGTVNYDSHGAITTGASWSYRCPVAGYYNINASVLFNSGGGWASGETAQLSVFKNGTLYSYLQNNVQQAAHTTFVPSVGSDVVQANAGDTIQIKIFQNSGASLALFTDATYNYVTIERTSGPSQIAATELISSAAYRTSVQSIPNTTDTILIGNLEDHDTHGAYNSSTGVFTCPAAGIYEVMGATHWGASGTGTRAMKVRKNSSIVTTTQIPGLAGASFSTYVYGSFRCVAGDTLDVVVRQDTGGAIDAYSDASRYTIINIKRIG